MKWDDLKVALAIERGGSAAAAATALGLTASTVHRRIAALEASLGAQLFDRLKTGYQPTVAGRRVLKHAATMQQQATELVFGAAQGDQSLSGPLRLTVPSHILTMLTPTLGRFALKHPDVELAVIVRDSHLDLSQRQADVAVRLTPAPPETLVGRRACDMSTAVYASHEYLNAPPSPHRLVGEDDARTAPDWAPENGRVVSRANALFWTLQATVLGLGLGRLPCFMGDAHPALRRFSPPIEPQDYYGVWVLTHARLRTVARVKALTDTLFDALRNERPLFEGDQG